MITYNQRGCRRAVVTLTKTASVMACAEILSPPSWHFIADRNLRRGEGERRGIDGGGRQLGQERYVDIGRVAAARPVYRHPKTSRLHLVKTYKQKKKHFLFND